MKYSVFKFSSGYLEELNKNVITTSTEDLKGLTLRSTMRVSGTYVSDRLSEDEIKRMKDFAESTRESFIEGLKDKTLDDTGRVAGTPKRSVI